MTEKIKVTVRWFDGFKRAINQICKRSFIFRLKTDRRNNI